MGSEMCIRDSFMCLHLIVHTNFCNRMHACMPQRILFIGTSKSTWIVRSRIMRVYTCKNVRFFLLVTNKCPKLWQGRPIDISNSSEKEIKQKKGERNLFICARPKTFVLPFFPCYFLLSPRPKYVDDDAESYRDGLSSLESVLLQQQHKMNSRHHFHF